MHASSPPRPAIGAGTPAGVAEHVEIGSKPDIAAVFVEHSAYVYRVLRRLGASEADAEDLCQEVFIIVARKLDQFEGRSALRTWIYGICIRIAANHRRSHRRRAQGALRSAELDGVRSVPATDGEVAARQLLDRLLDALIPSQREVLVLYEIEQLTLGEVAQILGCPLGTVASRLRAARESLKHAAARHGVALHGRATEGGQR